MMEETEELSGKRDEAESFRMEDPGRVRSDSVSSGAAQSSAGRPLLRHRLGRLMTCVDELDPRSQLHDRVARTLDGAFLAWGRRAHEARKDAFRLHMVTWNVATVDPPDDVTLLLHLNAPKSPDLYVIGLQEVYSGPVRFMSDRVFDDSWSKLLMDTLAPRSYVKVSSIRLQGLLLLCFCKLQHLPFIRDVQARYTRTGIYGYWGNKGGVSVRLSFYGHLLCFLNCHLAAHMEYASERVDEFQSILDTQAFDCPTAPRITDHRLVFWFGDLNFRIQDHGMHFVRSCIAEQSYELLWSQDQLTMMKNKDKTLQEFEEGPLDFPPTYKFDLNSDTYDSRLYRTWFGFTGKKRKPAWTDRILWRLRHTEEEEEEEEYPLRIRQELYTSNMEYSCSDHKPVIGVFTLELRKMCAGPLVRLQPDGDWSADMDAMVLYSPLQPITASPWDWIGLYKVGFTSVSDYITYTWVKDNEVTSSEDVVQVYVSKEEIPVRGGECVLCYYSDALQCIVGVSEAFKVQGSKVASEEGLMPGNLDALDRTVSREDLLD